MQSFKKQTYTTPKLSVYGSVEEITQVKVLGGADRRGGEQRQRASKNPGSRDSRGGRQRRGS